MNRTVSAQFEDAAEEFAIGIAPPVALGAMITISAIALTNSPAFAAFAGSASVFVAFHFWIRHLIRRDDSEVPA